jgi:hypothetical protein
VSAGLAASTCLGKTAQELRERIDRRTIQTVEEFMMFYGLEGLGLIKIDDKRYCENYIYVLMWREMRGGFC